MEEAICRGDGKVGGRGGGGEGLRCLIGPIFVVETSW